MAGSEPRVCTDIELVSEAIAVVTGDAELQLLGVAQPEDHHRYATAARASLWDRWTARGFMWVANKTTEDVEVGLALGEPFKALKEQQVQADVGAGPANANVSVAARSVWEHLPQHKFIRNPVPAGEKICIRADNNSYLSVRRQKDGKWHVIDLLVKPGHIVKVSGDRVLANEQLPWLQPSQ